VMQIEELGPDHAGEIAALYARDSDRWRAEKAWPWRLHERSGAVGLREQGKLKGMMAASPCELRVMGQQYSAAQVAGGGLAVSSGDVEQDAAMLNALFEHLAAKGVQVAYAACRDEHVDQLQALGFRWLFEGFGRNLYVSLDKVSSRLSKAALTPFRRFATEARRLRPKLVDVPLDETRIAELAALYAMDDSSADTFGLVKDEAYLRWRYLQDPRASHRMLTYRSRAGQGASAVAIVRRFEPEGGRPILHLEDHWTRRDSRRDVAKLVGELAMVALSEECDALRCFAAAGSCIEQALISMSCIRKKVDRNLMLRPLSADIELADPFPTERIQLSSGDLSLYET